MAERHDGVPFDRTHGVHIRTVEEAETVINYYVSEYGHKNTSLKHSNYLQYPYFAMHDDNVLTGWSHDLSISYIEYAEWYDRIFCNSDIGEVSGSVVEMLFA